MIRLMIGLSLTVCGVGKMKGRALSGASEARTIITYNDDRCQIQDIVEMSVKMMMNVHYLVSRSLLNIRSTINSFQYKHR